MIWAPRARADEGAPETGAQDGAAAQESEEAARKVRHAKDSKRFAKKGRKAYRAERWDDAISAFRLAHDLDPKPSFLFNIARCQAKRGDLAEAVEAMEQYVEDETDEGERSDGEDELRILKRRLASTYTLIDISTVPSGAAVVLRTKEREVADTAPFERWLPAGAWTMTVSLPDYEQQSEQLVARPGETVAIKVELERVPEPEPPPMAKAPPPPPPPPPPSQLTTVSWIISGAGAALILSGAIAGAFAASAATDRNDLANKEVFHDEIIQADDRAKSRAVLANVLFGLGATALVSGAGLYLLVTPTAAGLGGRF